MNMNRMIILSCFAIIILLQVVGWFRGRWWVMSDADTPNYGQTGCCTILLSSGDVTLRQSIHQSLNDHTDIFSRLKGVIESKAYSPSLFAIGYIKISAPEGSLGQIVMTVRDHLLSAFPSITPEYLLGFSPAAGEGPPSSP
jgi:hypothetical protein